MRIKNLEFKKATYLGEEPEYPSYHINLWEKNCYYGNEDKYIKDGNYYIDSEYSNFRIHKDCFKNPEYCFAIASFDYDSEGFYELHFIGDRPITHDYKLDDFWDLIKYGYNYLNENSESED